MSTEIDPPGFQPPADDGVEVWCFRASSHLNVSEVLNGATVEIATDLLTSTSTSALSAIILSKFQGKDGNEYSLSAADANETESMRLLVPGDDDALVPFGPFRGQINLTSAMSGLGSARGEASKSVQSDLLLAPAKDRAPKPAFDQSGNGAVDTMRLAYVPVAQRGGLRKRWQMPGSGGSPSKKPRLGDTPKMDAIEAVSDDEVQTIEKKKKEKKSKKSRKKE